MTLKEAFVDNGELTITPENFPQYIRLLSFIVGLMHIGYYIIMAFADLGLLTHFNTISIIIYFSCTIFCTKKKQTAITFYMAYFEIIIFSMLMGTCIPYTVTFPLLNLILIPLACLMKFWQDSIYHESYFHAGRMVIVVSLAFLLTSIKALFLPEYGIVEIGEKYVQILNTYNVLISLLTVIATGIAFTSVSVREAQNRQNRFNALSEKLVIALSQSVEAKDEYTKGHSSRVAKYSRMIAERAGWPEEKLKNVYFAGLLHDVGKIGIADTIINKKGGLSDEEFEVVKTHPKVGERILDDITEIPELLLTAKHHHERWDGKGYPDKLSGYLIPEFARLVGVADTYDAMTSNRSYRALLPQDQVIKEMEKAIGTQFDPFFGKIMLDIIKEDTEYTMHE